MQLYKQIFILLLCFYSLKVNAQAEKSSLSEGAKLLFNNIKTTLTNTGKQAIYDSLGFKLSKDKKQFIADADAADFPFDAFVYPTDINNDGKEEVFVLFGNTYTSGNTGSSITLFIQDKNGVYRTNLGFPGTLPDVIATPGSAYPDLIIGRPGFDFPVWRWSGKEYAFNKSIKEQSLKTLKTKSIETISKAYTGTLK